MESKGKTTVTLPSGLELDIPATAMNNARVLDGLTVMEDPDSNEFDRLKAQNRVLREILGEEQKEKLYKHLEEVEGVARESGPNSVSSTLSEIFRQLSTRKKK